MVLRSSLLHRRRQSLLLVNGANDKTFESLASWQLRMIRSFSATSSSPTTTHTENGTDESSAPRNRPLRRQSSSLAQTAGAYATLAKARLSALVVFTSGTGFLAAGPVVDPTALVGCVLGTAGCAASASALNQWYEIDRDARMQRTKQRPLVTGSISPPQAVAAASLWGVGGTALLWTTCDPLTAALGCANIGLYAGVYTYLKPRSVLNTWVGAVVGAVPPVMGWTAATAGLTTTTTAAVSAAPAVVLGSLLYFWQMPHFFALSYMYRDDYQRGGFKMAACVDAKEAAQNGVDIDTARQAASDWTADLILRYTVYLATIPPLVATVGDVTSSSMFLGECLVANAYAVYVAARFRQDRTNANAKRIFFTSLVYLPSILMLFLLHSKTWDVEKEENALWLTQQVQALRARGRELCYHESAAAAAKESHNSNSNSDKEYSTEQSSCPVTVAVQQKERIQTEVATAASQTLTAAQEAYTNGRT